MHRDGFIVAERGEGVNGGQRRIYSRFYMGSVLSRLELFPLSGSLPRDKQLRDGGYRYVIADKYICVYKLIGETVYVYHIAHGAGNYPLLFKRLLRDEKE